MTSRPVAARVADPTREAAFALVSAVLDRHRPLDDALDALPPLDARDRAAGHRLAAAVLRRIGSLDAMLEPHLAKQPREPVRHVLRIGAAGLLLLGTPRMPRSPLPWRWPAASGWLRSPAW